jgi:hypothetical protein
MNPSSDFSNSAIGQIGGYGAHRAELLVRRIGADVLVQQLSAASVPTRFPSAVR